jgi:predicted TIM-barrel fold metal-dependent hydrolase
VCTLAASYEATLDGVAEYLARLTSTEREAILTGTAQRWYRIDAELEPQEALD